MQEFYTMVEVSRIMGVNRSTVWRWIKTGKMKYVIIGGKKTCSYFPNIFEGELTWK